MAHRTSVLAVAKLAPGFAPCRGGEVPAKPVWRMRHLRLVTGAAEVLLVTDQASGLAGLTGHAMLGQPERPMILRGVPRVAGAAEVRLMTGLACSLAGPCTFLVTRKPAGLMRGGSSLLATVADVAEIARVADGTALCVLSRLGGMSHLPLRGVRPAERVAVCAPARLVTAAARDGVAERLPTMLVDPVGATVLPPQGVTVATEGEL